MRTNFASITIIIVIALSSFSAFSQDSIDQNAEYYSFQAWKHEYDQAVQEHRKYQKSANAFLWSTAIFGGVTIFFPTENGLIISVVGSVPSFIGYVGTRSRANKAKQKALNLQYEAQQKDWLLNPPIYKKEPINKAGIKNETDVSLQERLVRLQKLRDDGIINNEEYLKRRKEILDEFK